MERIGIAASKIAKGNLFLYNVYVIVLSFLLSLLLFLLAGSAIFLGLWVIRLVIGPLIPSMSQKLWNVIFSFSLISLTFVVTSVSLVAVSKNIKFKK
ncbi:MAG: hypothetical protein H6754_07840 [Candidatus Omnitrophica bacterium]|nr:hypothetical protein [Candidatus Omnitrophota bacterium]